MSRILKKISLSDEFFSDKSFEEIEKSHPEEMAKIKKLREERNAINQKIMELHNQEAEKQKQIDELYLKIGGFDEYFGKYIKINNITYMKVDSVERLMTGARIKGDTVTYYNTPGYKFSSFDSGYSYDFQYGGMKPEIITEKEYSEIVEKSKKIFM